MINGSFLSDASTLTIGSPETSNGVVFLPYAGTDTVAALIIDGISQPAGIYDSENTDGAIIGLGKIQIDPYVSLLAVIEDPADRDPGDDPDADGIPNAVEFVIGGTPTGRRPALLPTSQVVTTNFGTGATPYLRFTYRQIPLPAYIVVGAEYATDLTGTWTPAVSGTAGVIVVSTTNGFGSGVDKVEVYIPRELGLSGKIFARLKVLVSPRSPQQ